MIARVFESKDASPALKDTWRIFRIMAELVDGYTDLVTDVAGGRRRLPEQ